MDGGGGANVYVAGNGTELMDGKGASSNLFESNQSSDVGSATEILHFTAGRDHLHLVGYDTASALASAHVVGGNTIISLDGGATQIELVGFKHLTAGDFN
jgi:hypothetical protein